MTGRRKHEQRKTKKAHTERLAADELAAAAAVALGLFLALGMNALLPTYENKVLPLEKELLAPAPVYEAIEETLTLYPWNLYDAARVSSLSESDKAALGVRLWQIFDWLYICLSEDQIRRKS